MRLEGVASPHMKRTHRPFISCVSLEHVCDALRDAEREKGASYHSQINVSLTCDDRIVTAKAAPDPFSIAQIRLIMLKAKWNGFQCS